MNTCVSSCNTTTIHLSYGWFSSVRLIKPHIFNCLHFNDYIVNDGKLLLNGRMLSFQWNLPRSPFYSSPIVRFKPNGPANYE
ncbi:tapetum determinant protein [Perilla frutescens var. hirtella]|uniref:Tapetum determinant protein n=1 Tax=Perilla frutescens var. hirtella TaxID=608512 RepID=A0AAD4IY28_PERFH|nr:tapetum determinant protein [Perilla frutescens var. hirtella]